MGEKLVINPSFDICCPKCDEVNTIKVHEEIQCKKCNSSFSRKIFFEKTSCSLISKVLIGAALGVGGAVYTENQKIEQKIPIPVERTYNFVQTCISVHRIDDKYYTKKIRDNCFCAVQMLSVEHNIQEAKVSNEKLQEYYNKCTNQ